MDEYTPTTDEVRAQWGYNYPHYDNTPEEFDRWLEQVTRNAWARGYNEGYSTAEKLGGSQ